MDNIRKKDLIENFYGGIPTAHIHARFINGKFYEIETKNLIKLKEGALVRITTNRINIRDEDYERYSDQETKIVMHKGEILHFEMPYKNNRFFFKLRLLNDLKMKKEGNKSAKAELCNCEVYQYDSKFSVEIPEFKPFRAETLNQAYFQASIKVRPENKSHTVNIYTNFRLENGRLLESLRFLKMYILLSQTLSSILSLSET